MAIDYEMARAAEFDRRAVAAQAVGAQAFGRLLRLSEDGSGGQARRVAGFLAATYDSERFPLDVFELRTVDVAISDDMLACLDALRWGRADLHKLVPDGEERLLRVLETWGIKWTDTGHVSPVPRG